MGKNGACSDIDDDLVESRKWGLQEQRVWMGEFMQTQVHMVWSLWINLFQWNILQNHWKLTSLHGAHDLNLASCTLVTLPCFLPSFQFSSSSTNPCRTSKEIRHILSVKLCVEVLTLKWKVSNQNGVVQDGRILKERITAKLPQKAELLGDTSPFTTGPKRQHWYHKQW
jgi:hypothetical protein